jgi:hypothetical protein
MRGNDELSALAGKLMEASKQGQLPGRRQRRLRLVEEIKPAAAEPVHHQRQEGFPVRHFVQGVAPIRVDDPRRRVRFLVEPFDLARHVEKALGAKEKAVAWPADALGQAQELVERRMRGARGEVEIAAAALRIEAHPAPVRIIAYSTTISPVIPAQS